MTDIKKFKLGGLDLKSMDLVRDALRASDLRNITKTQKGDLDKRPGYEEGEAAAFELEESTYYKTNDETLFIKSDGTFHKLYNGTRLNCTIKSLFPNVGLAVKNRIVYDEYQSNMYFTTSDGKSRVVKYDGSDAYLAGIPSPNALYDGSSAILSSSPGQYHFRWFYGHKDLNGNLTFGPYVQGTSSDTTPDLTVGTWKTGNAYGEFYNKYLILPALSVFTVNSTVPGTTNKFPYSSTNYVVGDKFLIDQEVLYPAVVTSDPSGIKWKAVTITAIGGGEITLDATELGTFSFSVTSAPSINLDTRSRLYIYKSTSESFGYISCCTVVDGVLTQLALDHSQDNMTFGTNFGVPALAFEDLYNEDGQKLCPPQCKFLAAYGDQMAYANIVGLWDQENLFTQYNNDDIMTYSDFGIGDNGENHSANIQKIGESFDGGITGIKRCNDLLVVTKDNSVFALDGILESGGYSLRKIPTDYIGCKSHNSILQVKGGLFFNGNDGVYFTDGVSCSKMTDLIDPFFNTIDATMTKSSVSIEYDKFVFYMTDGTNHYGVVFDYHFKEWFIWEDLDMSKGLYQKDDDLLYFAKGSNEYKFEESYSDDDVAIDAYYASNWEDCGAPAVDKKFKYIRIWNLTADATSFQMAIQKNWKNTDLHTVDVDIPAYSSVQKAFPQTNVMAIRFVFRNNVDDQNMRISAYQLEFEATQAIDKGN